jgi:Na+:H+ antiporter, NhaA family
VEGFQGNRLDRPVGTDDHVLGPPDAPITLVEYGSYACPYCRAANERIAEVRDQLGDRLRYVFRHKPLADSDLARRAAELVEYAATAEAFWDAHVELMSRSETLTEDDLEVVAANLGIDADQPPAEKARHVAARVERDESSARASGVRITPTFFINGRRYDGPWDESSFTDAMLGTLGHRVHSAAIQFASWGPSAGILLLLATVLAVCLTNSPVGGPFEAFWQQHLGVTFGNATFELSLRHWVNDALLTIFFLVVGLEIKREFTVGRLASRRTAALPVAAAIGGMAVPALLYLAILPTGPWSHGWGVPMATDTAFAVALIVMLGRRVPVDLRIFLTAAAIVDDIGAIVVVAFFYSGDLALGYLAGSGVVVGGLMLLNKARVYRVAPFALLGIVLWACIHASGLHATLAGVVLALFIPTRPPPNLKALATQASTIMAAEARRGDEVLHHGPSVLALRALDAIHDRLESPADRLLRHAGARSSYIVLPVFALANAGVVLSADVLAGHGSLMAAIAAGLVVGKPLGLVSASAIAVALRLAVKPPEYTWRQLAGAGALAGIGFTMSLFIAGQAFAAPADFAAAKIAVFGASVVSALVGVCLLWRAAAPGR